MATPWDIRGKHVLVTGATSGIGKETALALARRGALVSVTARDEKKCDEIQTAFASEGLNLAHVFIADFTALAAVATLANEVRTKLPALHVLINNAGVMPHGPTQTQDGFELNAGVNFYAPVLLTELLLLQLREHAPARIVNVASTMHAQGMINLSTFGDVRTFDHYRSYANSKLALILYTQSLANRLGGSGVTVNALHPGVVATEMTLAGLRTKSFVRGLLSRMRMQLKTPAEGSYTSVFLATSDAVSDWNGEYVVGEEKTAPSISEHDRVQTDALMEHTMRTLAPYLTQAKK